MYIHRMYISIYIYIILWQVLNPKQSLICSFRRPQIDHPFLIYLLITSLEFLLGRPTVGLLKIGLIYVEHVLSDTISELGQTFTIRLGTSENDGKKHEKGGKKQNMSDMSLKIIKFIRIKPIPQYQHQ